MFTRIYLHIPFCVQKCSYCSFFSVPSSADAIASYCHLLQNEIKLSALVNGCRKVDSIYFGGGTPSLLNPQQISLLLKTIDAHFNIAPAAEITLEVNPGTVTLQNLRDFRSCAVNRISVGVQSFDDKMLQALGRIHTAKQSRQAVSVARRAGFDNLGIDLMHGLPGQSLANWQNEICNAVELATEHISVYGLTIEEGTPYFARYGEDSDDLADDELSAQMFEMADEKLAMAGFEHYEIANYARPGFRSQHNSGYWLRDGYLGLGAGAHSLIRQDCGDMRFSNPSDLAQYNSILAQGDLPRIEFVLLEQKDVISEFMFLGLRLREGISYVHFFDEFGIYLQDYYKKEISQLVLAGLLVEESGFIRLTNRGMLLSNQVFSCFL